MADTKKVCSGLQGRLKGYKQGSVNICYRWIEVMDKRKILESIPGKWMLISRKKSLLFLNSQRSNDTKLFRVLDLEAHMVNNFSISYSQNWMKVQMGKFTGN